uniref:Acyl-CoA-binding domain-containing protein 5 n=1 Tax=Monopterus albus TaxID=43700 RepID=A0A3Q3JTC8_MONAL|nr:acyl-CoA-binding domain-containing protein 5 [Monopterus albus]XP_020455264.1 acyl-CoA-binding domain-containing protein 5 [Monopterus albus]XP_020455273.1 acyl-CoA-binding domain-containing protein 5 [Monopterus albus]XP_020455281.1 acyl-CoA-binding domain-containing protein 5 [Monopterus albus]
MEAECVKVEDGRCLTQLRFEAAVKVIRSLSPDGPFQPSNEMMLNFYSYYKQATLGPCNTQRPHFWDAVGRAKWDAWHSLGDMPKEEAMEAYVDEMKLILEGMPVTEEVENFLRVLGPFYEMVEDKKRITQISDLSTGLDITLNSVPSKSAAKSIIRKLEMNGTLQSTPARLKSEEMRGSSGEDAQDEGDDEEEEEEEEEEVVTREKRKANGSSQLRRTRVTHLNNWSHSGDDLNSDDSQEDSASKLMYNGHHEDPSVDVSGQVNLASDSDSEIFCDSVDQFGQEESSEGNRCHEEKGEDYNVMQHVEEMQEDVQDPTEVVWCVEDGENRHTVSQRELKDADALYNITLKRAWASRASGDCPGSVMPVRRGGDENGSSSSGGTETPAEGLNDQIVVVLARLQEDMQSVLERLNNLETLTASQTRSVTLPPAHRSHLLNKKSQKPSRWPFDISLIGWAIALSWPFVLQWLIYQYVQRKRHRN